MRRYRARIAKKRQYLHEKFALENSRRQLAEIRTCKEQSANNQTVDDEVLNTITSCEINPQVDMESNQTATGNNSDGESSEYETLSSSRRPLTMNDSEILSCRD